MSEENVEIVRRAMDAYERRDFATLFAFYDREIEWHVGQLMAQATGSGQVGEIGDFDPVYYGHEGIRDFWRSWLEAWETISFDYEEFIDAGDTVIVMLSQHTRGRASGIELELSYAQAWTVQGGKITRMEFFPTRNDALGAAGLSE
jgi:ketosteroid isomerase-like protein